MDFFPRSETLVSSDFKSSKHNLIQKREGFTSKFSKIVSNPSNTERQEKLEIVEPNYPPTFSIHNIHLSLITKEGKQKDGSTTKDGNNKRNCAPSGRRNPVQTDGNVPLPPRPKLLNLLEAAQEIAASSKPLVKGTAAKMNGSSIPAKNGVGKANQPTVGKYKGGSPWSAGRLCRSLPTSPMEEAHQKLPKILKKLAPGSPQFAPKLRPLEEECQRQQQIDKGARKQRYQEKEDREVESHQQEEVQEASWKPRELAFLSKVSLNRSFQRMGSLDAVNLDSIWIRRQRRYSAMSSTTSAATSAATCGIKDDSAICRTPRLPLRKLPKWGQNCRVPLKVSPSQQKEATAMERSAPEEGSSSSGTGVSSAGDWEIKEGSEEAGFQLRRQLAEPEISLNAALRAVGSDPLCPSSYLQLGLAHAKLGHHWSSLQAFKRGLALWDKDENRARKDKLDQLVLNAEWELCHSRRVASLQMDQSGAATSLAFFSPLSTSSSSSSSSSTSASRSSPSSFSRYKPKKASEKDGFSGYLAVGTDGGAISLWEADTWLHVGDLKGHLARVTTIRWSPAGRCLVSCSEDGAVLLWTQGSGSFRKLPEVSKDKENRPFPSLRSTLIGGRERGGPVAIGGPTFVAVSEDGTKVAVGAVGAMGNTVSLWDTGSGKAAGRFLHGETVSGVSLSRDGSFLSVCGGCGSLDVWNAVTRERMLSLRGSANESAVGFFSGGSPGQPWLLTCHSGGSGGSHLSLRLWRVGPVGLSSHEAVVEVFSDSFSGEFASFLGPICGVEIGESTAAGGAAAAVTFSDGSVALWSPLRGGADTEQLQVLEGTGREGGDKTHFVFQLSFSPCGQFLAGSRSDGRVCVWGLRSRHLRCCVGSFGRAKHSLSWLRSGKRLLLAAVDSSKTVHVWGPEMDLEYYHIV